MNPPQVYLCSPSWTLLPPPSPYHPSGLSQCTSPKHPVSCIEPGLAIHFIYDIIHVSMPFSQITPPSPSPTESKRLFYTSVSLSWGPPLLRDGIRVSAFCSPWPPPLLTLLICRLRQAVGRRDLGWGPWWPSLEPRQRCHCPGKQPPRAIHLPYAELGKEPMGLPSSVFSTLSLLPWPKQGIRRQVFKNYFHKWSKNPGG